MELSTVAVVGSVIAALVSVPAAPVLFQNVDGAVATLTGNAAADTPHTVTSRRSPDGFRETVRTAQGTATFDGTSTRFTMTLESALFTVTAVSSPTARSQRIVAGPATLVVNRTTGRTVRSCETTDGILTARRENGAVERRFSGVNRSRVRATCQRLRDRLQQGVATLTQTAADLDLITGEVDVTTIDADTEVVVLANTGPVTADLDGWTLRDEAGTTYTFDALELGPGERVRVYSGDAGNATTCSPSDTPPYERCWTTSSVWNGGSDTAILRSDDGSEMARYSYP